MMGETLWRRKDIAVFVQGWSGEPEFREFIVQLHAICPLAAYRDGTRIGYNSGTELCLGWKGEPIYQYSWGGISNYRGAKLWDYREFLDHLGYNNY